MEEKAILVQYESCSITITLNRLAHRNSINEELIDELNDVLDKVETDSDIKLIFLKGQGGYFCTGMDFDMYVSRKSTCNQDKEKKKLTERYMDTIKRLTMMGKIVISIVDGQVMAGGIGLLAASDLVIATSKSQFSLSEMIWGLLPAMVVPYLIRRIGFQRAYHLTLTTIPITADQALKINLIDELDEQPEVCVRRYKSRFLRLEESTVAEMKQYFRKMWIITEEMEKTAVDEISYLTEKPNVKKNIENFVNYKIFPWETEK